MGGEKLSTFFDSYLEKDSLFKNKGAFSPQYTPDIIPHRAEEIKQMANILAPVLRGEKPSNLFLYGKTGTGKTLSVKYTSSQIIEAAKKHNVNKPLKVVYINCKLKKIADTEYRLIAELGRNFGKEIPPTGLPTDEVYKIFFSAIDKKEQLVLLVLDEIDQLVKKAGDAVLYNLTRINTELKKAQISIVGISNDLLFTDLLDPRVKSSLSEEEIMFSPYNALQLQEILKQRVSHAFSNEAIEQGVVEKCAAYAAREHGDARRALELLRVAGEIAERELKEKVLIEHIDQAEKKIEKDRITEIIAVQPKQFQVVLYAIMKISEQKKDLFFTGEVYELYQALCNKVKIRPLTQRRVSDIIGELDMLGIINAKVISKGRYGRTREIRVSANELFNDKIRHRLAEGLL